MRRISSRIATPLFALTVLAATSLPVLAQDLFSRGGLDSLFNDPPQQAPSQEPGGVLSPAQIPEFIRSMGYDPVHAEGNIYIISVQNGTRTYPVLVLLDDTQVQFRIAVGLTRFDSPPPADKLLALMEAGFAYSPFRFAYLSENKGLFLLHSLENRNLNPQQVRTHIENVSEAATQTVQLWDLQGQPVPAPTNNRVGTWKASQNGQLIITLTLNADGTFLFVSHPNNVTLKGQYTIDGNILVLLHEDGSREPINVTWNGDNRFDWHLAENGGSIPFVRS